MSPAAGQFVHLSSNYPGMSVNDEKAHKWLPPINSPKYHLLMGLVAILILGPLGGVAAAYMNFSLGFFVGGQVLAGILGSTITFGYGPEGKHGANYMQTMAASVAGLSGMAVLVQAMVWLGLPQPPTWQLILYFTCIGMFGVGVGMLYTPILVDKMQLIYPSGYAVANILRALTDKNLLKRSISKLGGGALGGFVGGLASAHLDKMAKFIGNLFGGQAATSVANQITKLAGGFSAANVGAGMVVGARIAVPAFVMGIVGYWLTPYFREIGWLGDKDPFRKIGFMIGLGMIMGAAIVDLTLIGIEAVKRFTQKRSAPVVEMPDWKRVNMWMLVLWVAGWAVGVVVVGSAVLHQPILFVGMAVALTFLFILINGISTGISDSNPISSAFVVAVFIMAAVGLKDAATGLMCASILLIACGVGVDMQQDRSTGWRLGTNRRIQFRYQVIGIVIGAVMAVFLAKTFMSSYPILKVDIYTHPDTPGAEQWSSAMTFKFVGALKALTNPKPYVMTALEIGVGIGLLTEILRKVIKSRAGYKKFAKGSGTGKTADFMLDAVVLPSPYASSFGGFLELSTCVWYTFGGVFSSLFDGIVSLRKKKSAPAEQELSSDMSTMSLVGGGLIAGDSLAALALGIFGLVKTLF
jgi:uncharacterized oligopeptide transporter (OPT) family protein